MAFVDAPLSEDDVQRFLDDGAITIDTPIAAESIRAGCAIVDARLPFVASSSPAEPVEHRFGETCSFYESPLVDLIAQPFFEKVAKQVLDADEVRLFQTAITIVHPQPDARWAFEQHIDVRYREDHWRARPREVVCTFFLWLCDVNERRAPMVHRPGSHRLLARNDRHGVPRVAGVAFDRLPARRYADPVPIVARAGQVSIVTTALVHGSSVNVDHEARRALVMPYTARGVEIELPPDQERQRRDYLRALAELLPPDRRHIARP